MLSPPSSFRSSRINAVYSFMSIAAFYYPLLFIINIIRTLLLPKRYHKFFIQLHKNEVRYHSYDTGNTDDSAYYQRGSVNVKIEKDILLNKELSFILTVGNYRIKNSEQHDGEHYYTIVIDLYPRALFTLVGDFVILG